MKSSLYLYLALSAGIMTGCDSQSSSKKEPTAPIPGGENAGKETVENPGSDQPGEGNGTAGTGTETTGNSGESEGENGSGSEAGGLQLGLSVPRSVLLKDIGNGIAAKTVAFSARVDALRQASAQFCANISPEKKIEAQNAWKKVMLQWEEFELFQVGPLTTNEKALKFAIYGWPQAANLCMIDAGALDAQADPVSYVLPSQTNRKGLQAIEYLLFESQLATSCSRTNPVTARWEALTADVKEQARCAYLLPLTNELFANAEKLKNEWGPVNDNVLTRTIGNEAGEQAAVQSLFESLFYLDVEMKNQKLAAPAGQDKKLCAKTPAPCLDKEELRLSQLSREAMEANIRAFADLMFGFSDDGSARRGGFSALVRDHGGSSVATRSEDYASALSKIFGDSNASLPTLIKDQAQENCDLTQNSVLCKMRGLLKQIAADLKNEYTSILQVKVPVAPAGDND